VTIFQFDENIDYKAYIKRCNQEGFAVVKRFPKDLKNTGFPDPEVLKRCLLLGGVLVTLDHHMIDDHEPDVPEKSPGIIIIQHSPKIPYTMTQKSAEKIIEQFKKRISDWHKLSYANSIVRITDESITVGRKKENVVTYNCYKELSEQDCEDEIRQRLNDNAADN